MKSHELAAALLASPNVPVVINGWGSSEGTTFEVNDVSEIGTCSFNGSNDTAKTKRDAMGYILARECVWLGQCKDTPRRKPTKKEKALLVKESEKRANLKKNNPGLYSLLYAEIQPITPDAIIGMLEIEKTK